MPSLDDFAREKITALHSRALHRSLFETARSNGPWVERGGRLLLSFSCNDYLGLSQHPKLKDAAICAIREFGVGAGASRLVTGNHPLYGVLEQKLARLKGTEAACVFGSGYLANAGIVPAFVGVRDLIVIDELSHACLWAGANLARSRIEPFPHNDIEHLAGILSSLRPEFDRALILTDGVFSMDGDLAPLPLLARVARDHDAWLMVDDAHGLGVVGNGRGSCHAWQDVPKIDFLMGTMSKALGSYGGYLCASREVIDLIHSRARTLVYSTGLPPAEVAASIAAIEIIENEPDRTAKPLAIARYFTRALDLPLAQSAIVPIVLGSPERAIAAAARLETEGFLVTAIRPPTVPPGTSRLRFAFSALHAENDVDRLVGVVREKILSAGSASP